MHNIGEEASILQGNLFPEIAAISLQSGSSGNCIYVEAGETKLLFDAGLSGTLAEERLARFGRDIRDIDAVIISHDHADHIRCAGIYNRKYRLPLYVTPRTLDSAEERSPLGLLKDVRHFRAGDALSFQDVAVRTIPTPHDGEDGVVFVIEGNGKRLGIMTDLGHVFPGFEEDIRTLDAVFLESNYDEHMLRSGPYPVFLKKRIQGPGGHLSNRESAELLLAAAEYGRLRWACLSHLSGHNNHPSIALRTHRHILGNDFPLFIAGRHEPSDMLIL
ncbi:MAG: MBL fold metallo-hydrolase [bacterium]